MLAASKLSDATGVKPPLMLFNAAGVSQYGSSPIAVSTADLQTLKTIPAERGQSSNTDEKGTIYLINSGPQPPNMDPLKFLPSNWQVARRIGIENMPVASAQKFGKESDKNDTAACFVRMQVVSGDTEGIAEVAHRVSQTNPLIAAKRSQSADCMLCCSTSCKEDSSRSCQSSHRMTSQHQPTAFFPSKALRHLTVFLSP